MKVEHLSGFSAAVKMRLETGPNYPDAMTAILHMAVKAPAALEQELPLDAAAGKMASLKKIVGEEWEVSATHY